MSSKHTIESPIPVYELYGEEQQWLTPDLLHCEAIATRSRLHNWEILPHSHHGLLQLLWLEQGEATLQLDDWKGQLVAGGVLIVPQHCIHGFQFSTDAKGIVITLAYALLDSLGADLSTALQSESAARIFLLEENEEQSLIETMLRKLMKEYQQQQGYRRELIESSLTVVLACLMQQAQSMQPRLVEHPKRARRFLSEFTNLIEQDYVHHHQLTFYATKIGISTAHLNAVCREFIQRSALDLIHARIILEAKRNLVYTSLTIKSLCICRSNCFIHVNITSRIITIKSTLDRYSKFQIFGYRWVI